MKRRTRIYLVEITVTPHDGAHMRNNATHLYDGVHIIWNRSHFADDTTAVRHKWLAIRTCHWRWLSATELCYRCRCREHS